MNSNFPFKVNQKVKLSFDKKYVCRYGEISFKLEEITVPRYEQELTVRGVIKHHNTLTGEEGFGLRFHEILNPKFPMWVPTLGEDSIVNLEPVFNAKDFK